MAIAINGESGFRDLVLNENGDANLTFKLRYKSTQENVHAGQANALLYFDIDYQWGDMKIFISLFLFIISTNSFADDITHAGVVRIEGLITEKTCIISDESKKFYS